jgi:putative membrane protein
LKYLMWLLNAAIFFVLFAFALNNQAPVTLHLFFGASWQAPLVLVLLCVLLLGVVLGVVVMLPLWLRARKQRRLHPAPPVVATPPTVPDAVSTPHSSAHGS